MTVPENEFKLLTETVEYAVVPAGTDMEVGLAVTVKS